MKPTDPQPPPKPGTAPHSVDLVVADLAERKRHGIAKYGVAHQHDNGRDHLVDLYQELLDGCVYVRAQIEQQAQPNGEALVPESEHNRVCADLKRQLNAASERVLHEMARASEAETQLAEAKAISRVLALEEAARVLEVEPFLTNAAKRIRALKETPRS